MRFSAVIAIGALAALLSSCKVEAPTLAAGSVEAFESGRPVKTWQLSPRNLEQLQGWLQRNTDGWSRDFVSYAPRLKASLKGADGSFLALNLMDTTVIVYGTPGQFKQTFSREEIASLRASLGVE
jgi:hypothetical protein